MSNSPFKGPKFARFAAHVSSDETSTVGFASGGNDGVQSTRSEQGRRSRYLSIDAARVLFEEERNRISLYAIPFRGASLARPRWTLEIIYDTGPRYILQSRSRLSRPMFANAPSGVYGIAAEVGAEQVVLCIPNNE